MMIIVYNLPAVTINSLGACHAYVINDRSYVSVVGDVVVTFSWVSTIYRFGKRRQVA